MIGDSLQSAKALSQKISAKLTRYLEMRETSDTAILDKYKLVKCKIDAS